MRQAFFILFTIFILSTLTIQESLQTSQEEGVYVLTNDNFEQFLQQTPFVLVEFYAPWCGHCQNLAPEYAKAAQQLENDKINVKLAKVDATEQKQVASKFKISGYPTIRFFIDGNIENTIEYNGERNSQGIIDWCKKMTSGKISQLVETSEELEKLKSQHEALVVFYGLNEDDPKFKIFKILAMSNDDLTFAHVFDEDLRIKEKALRTNLVVYKHFDEKRNNYDQFFGVKYVERFLDNTTFPLVMPLNERGKKRFYRSTSFPTFVLFLDDSSDSQHVLKEFESVAQKQKGKYIFATLKKSDDFFSKLQEQLGTEGSSLPQIVVAQPGQSELKKYKFDLEINEQNILEYINQFKAGKIKKYLKSQPIPEKNNEYVVTVVGQNWEEVVKKSKKDVLVELYAPWCGHCKQLAPKYEQLAKKLSNNPNLVIAKVDATANEIPGLNIGSYPTIKFYKNKSKNQPIDFDGNREVNDIVNWLKEKVTYPWVEEINEDL